MTLLHGHRGARGLAPENTLAGFSRAISLGAAAIECDVTLTADDVVVVSHDPALNPDITRDADGQWLTGRRPLIRHLHHTALALYDVGRARPGSATALAFPDQVPQDGSRVPTLDQVLRLDPMISVDIELKTFPGRSELNLSPSQLAAAVAAVVMANPARVKLMSFDWRGLRWLRRHHPMIGLAWLTSGATACDTRTWWDGVRLEDHHGSVPRAVAAEGGPIWAPEFTTLTAAKIDEAHELGLQVIAWTVNEPDDIARLIQWGVDGIITDYPDRFPARPVRSSGHGEKIGIDRRPGHKGA